jgi:hypothetical protein
MEDVLMTIPIIMTITGLNARGFAVIAGVSPSTMLTVLKRHELPDRRHARERIEAAVRLNRDVKRRADLKFVP